MLTDDEKRRTDGSNDACGHQRRASHLLQSHAERIRPLSPRACHPDRHRVGDQRPMQRRHQDPDRVREGKSSKTSWPADSCHDDPDREVRGRSHALVCHRGRGTARCTTAEGHRVRNAWQTCPLPVSVARARALASLVRVMDESGWGGLSRRKARKRQRAVASTQIQGAIA